MKAAHSATGTNGDPSVAPVAEHGNHSAPLYRPSSGDSSEFDPEGLSEGDSATLLGALRHFSHWFLLLATFAAAFLGTRWLMSEPVRQTPRLQVIDKSPLTAPDGGGDAAAQEASAAGSAAAAAGAGARGGLDAGAASAVGATTPVLISSTPAGARLIVDGDVMPATTPARLTLRPGASIRLEAAGFEPLESRYREGAGAELHLTLSPRASSLERVRAPARVPYPRKVVHVEPARPASEPRSKGTAIVILTLEIDSRGNVIDVDILRSISPAFDRAASDAAWRWKFEPTSVDGRPVHVVGNFSVPIGAEARVSQRVP